MPKKAVILNYQKCEPQQCENGVCQAVAVCKRQVLIQLQPFEVPQLRSELCLGCAVCTTVCTLKALEAPQW